ncbi:hypothetical protein ACH5RR_030577 [Cinchona calisaya]|uniref:Uncharacterized protein n=1 Tax=Cinchona calisaya TaxID=153742 RepID=A0ABD2YV05_9GENT
MSPPGRDCKCKVALTASFCDCTTPVIEKAGSSLGARSKSITILTSVETWRPIAESSDKYATDDQLTGSSGGHGQKQVEVDRQVHVVALKLIRVEGFRGKVHQRFNAGNIFAGIYNVSWAIKFAYKGSTYFHNPGSESTIKIWDKEWSLSDLLCIASAEEENHIWRSNVEINEPSINEQLRLHFDVTALELAFGPLRGYRGYNARIQAYRLSSFLTAAQEEQNGRL